MMIAHMKTWYVCLLYCIVTECTLVTHEQRSFLIKEHIWNLIRDVPSLYIDENKYLIRISSKTCIFPIPCYRLIFYQLVRPSCRCGNNLFTSFKLVHPGCRYGDNLLTSFIQNLALKVFDKKRTNNITYCNILSNYYKKTNHTYYTLRLKTQITEKRMEN